jgi:hypothetical protein
MGRYAEGWVDWLWGGLERIVSGKGGRQNYWIYNLVPLDIDGTTTPGS